MKQFLLLLCLLLAAPLAARAQFFDFGFGDDPFFPRREQRRQEKATAPEYKGGQEAVERFLKKHYRNPAAGRAGVDGRIVVACIVDEKGRVAETHVVRGVGREFDEEARRVCRKMRFRPATRGKKKVRGRFDVSFPIRHSRLSFATLPTVRV